MITTTRTKKTKSAASAYKLANLPADGQTRVVIERVTPELNGGRFPIKAVPGDTIAVEADIFLDGHDKLAARLLYKHTDEPEWSEVPMAFIDNDRWGASFTVEKQGYYAYTIEGWADHIASWQHEVHLKVAAGQRITSELKAGAVYVGGMVERAAGEDRATLEWLTRLLEEAAEEYNEVQYSQVIEFVHGEPFKELFNRYPERKHPSRYSRELSVEVDRPKAGFSTWYCLFPRSASPELGPDGMPVHGTFRDVERLLPRLEAMGFDVLYLPPIHPIGHAFRKGKNNNVVAQPGEPGVPYGIGSELGGHTAIHPDLGTLDDFKHLIAIARNHGMEVAMDLAIQVSPDHPWAKDHPEWFKKRPDGTIQYAENPPKKYQDIYPVYFETDDWQSLWLEMRETMLTWASWGVRIIRVDNPHTKPFQFWEWLISEVKKQYPDMIFLSEAFTKPKVMQQLAKRGFAQSYTYFTWRNNKHELEEYLTELTQSEMKYYYRPNFWPTTHDINPYVLQTGHEPQFLIRYLLAATLSSNYGIYGPSFELMEHVPFPGKEEYLNSEKYEIRHWDWNRTNKLTYLIGLVNRIRKENPALQTTNNLTFCRIDDDALLAYLKVSGNNRLLMVINTDAYNRRAGMVQVPTWLLGIGDDQEYSVHDLLTGAHYTWRGQWNYVELDPYLLPMHLLKIES
ncbi:alpha-1,4-glucan:maltose-1-phosphate maltosyltransferase [Larkinella arboricola]|uniref:Alpha-1,4-glucan:maltose-1-phosphate maltosyltransferase n=1 Tax=Larkinella arboricola TaxID=643671 RepID=A0A327WTI4_LARAB|nr:alpha-1,4-glucan--maltose-1-phosphate maltosyltransferase [Larkinella arboricola]RAJ95942.1 alpha-1,4-glucan:maltose-1-phosphate maltosyltransferase [Larkinella arboricola]